jgi:hypothetical protein
MKKPITIKVNTGIDLLLKKLSEKEKRSQGQQIEKMIIDECKKQDIKC